MQNVALATYSTAGLGLVVMLTVDQTDLRETEVCLLEQVTVLKHACGCVWFQCASEAVGGKAAGVYSLPTYFLC